MPSSATTTLDRALQAEADHGTSGPTPSAAQVVREPVGAPVELAVGERARRRRRAPRRRACARLRPRTARGRSAPSRLEPAARRSTRRAAGAARAAGQQRQLARARASGVRDDALEQRLEVPDQPRRSSRRRTGRCCTRARPTSPPVASVERQGEVELRRPGPLGRRPAAAGSARRRPTSGSRSFWRTNITWKSGVRLGSRSGLQLLDQLLERQVLVRVGRRARPRARGRSSSRKLGSPDEVGAQHQRVDEEADQPLDLGAGAVGDRRADDDVVLAACSGGAAPGRPPAAS